MAVCDGDNLSPLVNFKRATLVKLLLLLLLLDCCLHFTKPVEAQAPALAPAPVGQMQAPLYPAMFIFGDSLVDSGNNNYVTLSLAKANIAPNGIDFPTHTATGRFCNGRTSFDVLSELVGLPYPPPALAPTSRGLAILRGLNYASGAAGILNDTGADYIERISFNQQIAIFQRSVLQLTLMLGRPAATALLHNSLYAVAMGSNDFINNYLLTSDNSTRVSYTPSQFVQLLMSTFRTQFTNLYNLGARKFVVSNVGPLGCIPSRLALGSDDGACVASDNQLVALFNAALKPLLKNLTQSLNGAMFLYGNSYDVVYDLIQDPFPAGFNVVNEGCCGAGEFNGQLPCLPVIDSLCTNRSLYVFWDPYHPTEAVNVILGNRTFAGASADISPMNVQQLSRVVL